jgi:hypothetical protein
MPFQIDSPIGSSGGSTKPVGVVSRVYMTLLFGVFLGMGLLFAVMLVRDFAQKLATRRWIPTSARVLDSGINVANGGAEYPYQPFVRYAYRFGGQERVSQVISLDSARMGDYGKAQIFVMQFGKGSQVTCYVNPADPSRAVLRHAAPWMILFIALPAVFILIGGGGLYVAWKPRGAPSAERPISDVGKQPRTIGTLFFGIFFLVGFGVAYPMLFLPLAGVIQARGWAEVPCVVERSQIIRHESSDSKGGPTYSVDILYRYEFQDRSWRSSRYCFLGGSSGGYSGKQAIVAAYPPGHKATCWVNPADPSSAVLNRGLTIGMLAGLVPILFMAIGAGGMFFSWKKLAPASGLPLSAASVHAAPAPASPHARADGQWILLAPMESPVKKLASIAIMAVVWNGMTAGGAYLFTRDAGGQGTSMWGAILFFAVFALIGVFLLVAAAGQALALANPRPKLHVSNDCIPLGGRASLKWTLVGHAGHVRRLRITLEGVEEAIYWRRSGKDGQDRTKTVERSTFCRQPVFESTSAASIAEGQVEVVVPAATMHGFTAPHNRVFWQLRVHGDIPLWPDVDETFGIGVEPLAIGENA